MAIEKIVIFHHDGTGAVRTWSERGELVRCANCKWFDISELSGTVEPIGYRCKLKQRFVDADDFCKRGERGKE